METKCGRSRKKKLCLRLGFNNYFIVDSIGKAGGLTLMWNEEIHLAYVWNTDRILHCELQDCEGSKQANLLVVHGTPFLAGKKLFCDQMDSVVSNFRGPWLVFGDLNEITVAGEKMGGREIWRKHLFLKEFMHNLGGIDWALLGGDLRGKTSKMGVL